jgi:drug/metabolite transporter (DMT)-like permease
MALYMIITRKFAGREHAIITTFQTSIIGAVLLSAALPVQWITPLPAQWGLMMLLGLVAVVGHYCIVVASEHAEASLLAPLSYTEMIMAVAVGWWFFGDFPDVWTFTGVAILIGCALYISWRERSVKVRTP